MRVGGENEGGHGEGRRHSNWVVTSARVVLNTVASNTIARIAGGNGFPSHGHGSHGAATTGGGKSSAAAAANWCSAAAAPRGGASAANRRSHACSCCTCRPARVFTTERGHLQGSAEFHGGAHAADGFSATASSRLEPQASYGTCRAGLSYRQRG